MQEDDDDPVVDEVPVYLSHALQNQLYIFQYPTRPAALPQENDKIIKCQFKPEHQELLMELSMDTHNPNYDVSHGEQIAINVDGGKNRPTNEKFFQSSVMDKRTLQSTRVAMDNGSVAVATIKNKQLIVTPVQGILSIQPSFPHLDVTDRRAKEEAKELGEDVSGGEEEEVEKQVTVKFARQESERLKRAREQSYNYLSRRSAEEKWYDTQYHLPTSRMAQVQKDRLICTSLDEQLSAMCLTPQQYVDQLVPVQQDPSWALPSQPSHVTSLTTLSNLPLPDIVTAVLKEVKIMTFQQLCGLLAGQGSAAKLLMVVQQVAVLVQGCWVVRSEGLYPRDAVSQHNGVPAEVMCRARDYILYLLSCGKTVDRRQVGGVVRLPPEELKELLTQFARLRKLKGWELALPPDTDFIQRYPEIVERQNRAWATKYKQLMEAFDSTKIRGRRRESSMSGSDLESSRARHRRDSTRSNSAMSDADSGGEGGAPRRRHKRNSESSDVKGRRKRNSNSESSDSKERRKRNSNSESGDSKERRKRNSNSESGDSKERRKRNSNSESGEGEKRSSESETKINGKIRRIKSEIPSPDKCS